MILWSGNHIGHRTKIGDNCVICVNACLADGVKIARELRCRCGAVVSHDIFEGLVYVGNPAETLPHRMSFDSFRTKEKIPLSTVAEEKLFSTVSLGSDPN